MEEATFPGDQQLLNYLDGLLTDAQAKEVERQINLSTSLKMRLEELRRIQVVLRSNGVLELPSDNFTQKVMRNLDSFTIQSFSSRNGILLLVGVLVAIGATLFVLQAGVFNGINGTIAVDSLPLKKEWIKNPLPSIPYNGKMIVNIILIVTAGLSFVLLDRTILRPWFAQRARMQRG
jgi:hypothetical protein